MNIFHQLWNDLYFGIEGVIYLFERLLIIKFDEKLQHKFIYLKVASQIQQIVFFICNGIDTKKCCLISSVFFKWGKDTKELELVM